MLPVNEQNIIFIYVLNVVFNECASETWYIGDACLKLRKQFHPSPICIAYGLSYNLVLKVIKMMTLYAVEWENFLSILFDAMARIHCLQHHKCNFLCVPDSTWTSGSWIVNKENMLDRSTLSLILEKQTWQICKCFTLPWT